MKKKFTNEQKRKALKALREGHNLEKVAKATGCCVTTLMNWQKKKPAIKTVVSDGDKAYFNLQMELQIEREINKRLLDKLIEREK